MTIQSSEIILYQNKRFYTGSNPLEEIEHKIQCPPSNFMADFTTNLWRGYRGTWKVENRKLYLISVSPGNRRKVNAINNFFGLCKDNKLGAFANWYSGVIEAYENPFFTRKKSFFEGSRTRMVFEEGVLVKSFIYHFSEHPWEIDKIIF